MRLLLCLFALSVLCFASNETNITRFLDVSLNTSCPGNLLTAVATSSDGLPAAGIELRLVLYEPYQGLRALQHTDQGGMARFELTKAGKYRLYIYTKNYNHDQYAEFAYPALCPPPPPRQMNITALPDCGKGILLVRAADANGTPLEGAFISVQDGRSWSSLSGKSGEVSFPLDEGDIFINASRGNYSTVGFYSTVDCTPPECLEDGQCASNQYCSEEKCVEAVGTCGYPANHSWVHYTCCSDTDCGNASMCINNTCILRPPPPQPQNITNLSNATPTAKNALPNETVNEGGKGVAGGCLGSALLLAGILIWKKNK
ncbi:MAG: hypothetical protein U0R44_02940 [Candidatus Micrarchaeia archaeon]